MQDLVQFQFRDALIRTSRVHPGDFTDEERVRLDSLDRALPVDTSTVLFFDEDEGVTETWIETDEEGNIIYRSNTILPDSEKLKYKVIPNGLFKCTTQEPTNAGRYVFGIDPITYVDPTSYRPFYIDSLETVLEELDTNTPTGMQENHTEIAVMREEDYLLMLDQLSQEEDV